jgi:hypothetical protein
MKKLLLILPLLILPLFLLVSCSEQNFESRELPTKYPETATMGSAEDVSKELYKK